MLWVSLGVLLLLAFFGYQRWKRMAPLFADDHLSEVAAALPDLKRRALAAVDTTPADPPSAQTAHLALAYSIKRRDEAWEHHVSVSNRVTPARAAGTFFLGLVRGLLGLDAAPFTAFVSQRMVFHVLVRLSDDEQRAFAERDLPGKTTEALRAIAIAGRAVILPRLTTAEVPLPSGRA